MREISTFLVKGIVICFAFIVAGITIYCNIKVSKANYNPAIKQIINDNFSTTNYKILDREFESDDNDVEFKILVKLNNTDSIVVELDCSCSCFGKKSIYCRLDDSEM